MELFIEGGLDTCISQGRGVEELINTLSSHLVSESRRELYLTLGTLEFLFLLVSKGLSLRVSLFRSGW